MRNFRFIYQNSLSPTWERAGVRGNALAMRNLLITASLCLGLAGLVYALPCDPSNNCELPASNSSQGSWTASASGMTGIQCSNSVGPTGNVIGSRYFFAAASTNLGPTVAKGGISTTGDGTRVIGSFALNSGSAPGSTVTGGVVQQLLGNQSYFFYAQACPSGQTLDSSLCSPWAQIGSKSSLAYPTSVFAAPLKPGEATVNSISAHTSVPVPDMGNISQIQLEVDNLITGGLNQTGILIGWPGANQANVVDSSLYTAGGGFKPNTKYLYKGQVFYPYGVAVPTAGPQQVPAISAPQAGFWTTPENPGTVTTSNITHCSVQITAQNSNVSAPNPTYTEYSLCAGAVCQTTGRIGGTPSFADTISATITSLSPGTPYTPAATALVGNQDGTQAGWNNSGATSGAGFTTLAWGGTFNVTSVFNTSATFTISGLSGAGSISSWKINANGATLASGSGDPTGTQTAIGLTPNTVYNTLQIVLTETNGCSSTLNFTNTTQFTTTPYAPTAGTGTAVNSTTIQANWTDASANGAGTQYQVQYCLDSGFSLSCLTKNVAKVAGSAQTTNITSLSEETNYYLRIKSLNITQPTGSFNADSPNFNFTNNPTTTLNAAPVVPAPTCTQIGTSNSATCTVSGVSDNDLTNGVNILYQWSVAPAAGTSFSPASTSNSSSSSNSTTFSYPSVQAYTVTVTVKDHNGSGASTSNSVVFDPGAIPTTISISPNSLTAITGIPATFNAIVTDQNGLIMANRHVNWSYSGGNSQINPVNNSSFTVLNATSTGNFVLTASSSPATPGTASITVNAAGPFFVTQPAITLSLKTGTLTALGNDNVSGATGLTYTWALQSGPASVSFDANNGTTNGNSVVVTFTAVGTYTFSCTLNNANGSASAATSPATLSQVLTTIVVTPTNITINVANTQQFTASGFDQFGAAMPALSGVAWSTSGGGNITGSGVFQSLSLGNNLRITATKNGVSGSALATVVNYDVSGAHPYPVPFKSTQGNVINFTGLGTHASVRIYAISGRLVYQTELDNPPDPWPWAPKNISGENLASGVYFYVIESPTTKKDGKLIIIQ